MRHFSYMAPLRSQAAASGGGCRGFFGIWCGGRSCWHCFWRAVGGVAEGRPRTARAGGVRVLNAPVAPSLPLRSRSAPRGGRRAPLLGGEVFAHSWILVKKKLAGCLGIQFSFCIRLTSAQNLWYVPLVRSAPFVASTMCSHTASLMRYCIHTCATNPGA